MNTTANTPVGTQLSRVEQGMMVFTTAFGRAHAAFDRLLAGPEMSVAAMVEDEIMLVLPQVPRHENCGVEGLVAQPKRASPFGVLAALKKGGG